MPDLLDLVLRWWRQILSLTIIAVVVTAMIVFFIPKRYIGIATALPAPAYVTDKAGVFGQNLRELYSATGSPDDLDKILGTAHLDTVYKAVAGRLDLAQHYRIKKGNASLFEAARCLKKRTRVIKTDYGELQVKAWDRDRTLAADLANAIIEKLQQIHQDVQTANNAMMLSKLKEEYEEKKVNYQKILDSLERPNTKAIADLLNVQKNSLLQQTEEYEQLLNQYQLMVDAKPQALVIIERASPALRADRPRTIQVIVAGGVLGFFFALLAALVLERRRMRT